MLLLNGRVLSSKLASMHNCIIVVSILDALQSNQGDNPGLQDGQLIVAVARDVETLRMTLRQAISYRIFKRVLLTMECQGCEVVVEETKKFILVAVV